MLTDRELCEHIRRDLDTAQREFNVGWLTVAINHTRAAHCGLTELRHRLIYRQAKEFNDLNPPEYEI